MRFIGRKKSKSFIQLISQLLIILLFSIPQSAWAEGTFKVQLTAAEQAWLAEHPEIVLGAATGYPPMVIKVPDGTHIGVVVDMFEEINQHLNTTIRLQIEDSWADIQEKAQNRELDGLAFGGKDPTRAALYNQTNVLMPTYFSVFARSQHEYQLKKFADLDGMRIGYKKAAGPTRSMLEKLPAAILKPYDSHESMTQALVSREIDVIVAWMSYDHWRKDKMQGTIDNIYIIEEYPIEMVSHIRNDWPELIPILNKAIAALHLDELPRINNKWFVQWPQFPDFFMTPEEQAWLEANPEFGKLAFQIRKRVQLSDEERDWLETRPKVSVQVGDYPPFFFVDDGSPQGMSINYVELICKAHQLDCNFVHGLTVAESIPSMKQPGGIAVQPGWQKNAERGKLALFTGVYVDSPFVIFQRKGDKRITGMDDLVGQRVVVEKNYAIHNLLKSRFPDLQLVEVNFSTEALKYLVQDKADAYVSSLMAGHYLSLAHGYPNIVVASPAPFEPNSLEIAVRKDWPELASIITKSVAAIMPEEHQIIHSKWLSIEYHEKVDYTLLWQILAVAGLAILVIILWNKQLSSMVKKRTSQLMETESRFRATFEQAAVGVAHVSLDGEFLRVNRKFCNITGYSEDEIKDLNFQDITHPDNLELDLNYIEQVLKGERENYSLDKKYVRKDGSVVWVNLTVSLVFDRGGNPKYFVSVIKDISGRKQAETNLAKSEANYRGLVDNSIIGVFSTTVDGRFTFINDAMVRMFDFDTPEQMIKEGSPARWKDPGDRERMLADLQKHGSVTNFEAATVTHTGRQIHVLFSAKQLGDIIVGMVMDISQRKQAEDKLHNALTEIEHLQKQLQAESAYLQEEIRLEHNFENIIGNSNAIQYALFKVEQVAEADSTVLVLGETGTGKELIARAIHHNSRRKDRPLIKINCATLPANLIESELFGHEKGSFTGASARHMGRFEVADGSSLFLDEIGELPIELQAKLLRVLEDGEFERLGSTRTLKVDVRIIAATNRDLEKDVKEGKFRQDLWYRLNVFPITLPPLRDRIEDIPMIVQYYLELFTRKLGKKIDSIPAKVMKTLQSYNWPGNVRELQNVLERAVISTNGTKLQLAEMLGQSDQGQPEVLKSLHDMERDYIVSVLDKTSWKVSGKNSTAEILGLDRSTLRARMKKLGIHKP